MDQELADARARSTAAGWPGGRDDTPIRSRLSVYLLFLVVVLLARAVSWPISLIHVDEYAFVLAGREVLAGHLPYTTFFDIKPVGPSVLLALAMAVLGQNLLAVRILGALCVLVAGIALYETARLTSVRRIDAPAAGVIYIGFSVLFGGSATMTEIMLAPFSCIGVLLLCRSVFAPPGEPTTRWLMLGAGTGFGLATLIKTVPVIPGAALGLGVLLHGAVLRRAPAANLAVRGLLFFAGLLAPTAATAAVYLATGHFAAFAYANYGFMRVYLHPEGVAVSVMRLAAIAAEMWPLLLIAALGCCLDLADFARRRAMDWFAAILYLWLAGELVASVVPLRMAEHYFLMTFPPLAILSARALARVVLDLADTRAGVRVFAGIVALMVLTPIMPAMRANAASAFKFPDPQRTTSHAIAALLPPDDRSLLVLSYDFMADYLFTRTPLPGRAAIPVHLFGPQTALLGPDPAAAIDALFASKPRVVLVDTFDLAQLATPEERQAVDRNLACCYRDAVTQKEVWAIGGRGSYHIADIHLFLRTDGKVPASP